MLHEDEGKAAVGLPQEEMSMESVAVEMDAGTLERYSVKSVRGRRLGKDVTYAPEPDARW